VRNAARVPLVRKVTALGLALVLAPGCCRSPQEFPIASRPEDEAQRPSTGRLHVPLRAHVVLQGLLIMGPPKGFEGGTNIRVQRIDGRATQERIRLKLAVTNPAGVHWEKICDGVYQYPHVGQTYELEGYEDGVFQGPTSEDLRAGVAVQAPSRYFTPHFVTLRAKRIDRVVLTPTDFVGREMLVEGIARSSQGRALLAGEGWSAVQEHVAGWPADVEGKPVQTRAVVRQTPTGELTVDGPWHLMRLEDQVGRNVELRGVVLAVNDHWWFVYRGTNLYVDDMQHLPTWSADLWWAPVEVRGRLERAVLPRIDQITLKSPPDPAMQFVVREGVLLRTTELLSPEVPEDASW
jgi:hypothetical protein